MAILSGIKNILGLEKQSVQVEDILLSAFLQGKTIDKEKALTLPAVSEAVDFISSMVACMPVKLFEKRDSKVTEIESDKRVALLNGDTGDTLNAYQLKKALVCDYLLDKGGFAFIERKYNTITGIYYIKPEFVTPFVNESAKGYPIYKYIEFRVGTNTYEDYEILRVLRDSKDGAVGKSLIGEISRALETAYQTLLYQLNMVKSGGNKRGFLKSNHKLGDDEIKKLKQAWRNLYKNNEENVVVLNNGLEFQEASSTAVESQLDQSKTSLSNDIRSVFHIKPNFDETFKQAVYPVVKAFETAINCTLLLEREKPSRYFAFDTSEITKAELLKRFQAHQIAVSTGWETVNEVRKQENQNHIEGLDVVNVGLSAVLYDTVNHTYYTPNTGQIVESGSKPTERSEADEIL